MKETAVRLLLIFLLGSNGFAQSDKPTTESGAQPAAPPDSKGPVIVKMVQPVFPLEAMQQKLQGQVIIHLVISTNGDVIAAEPVSGNPIFTQAAVAAMKQWKFQPYIRNGKAVQIGYKMPYDFAIGDRVRDYPGADAVPPQPSGAATENTGSAANPNRVTIDRQVSQGLLLHQVAPIYSDSARQRMVQGTVVLQAIIGKDGRIKDLKPVSGPKELYDSAVGAVQQWRYKPYTLNGEAVEVDTTINVNYKLKY